VTTNRVFLVIVTKIAQDLCLRRVGGANFLAAANHAVGLIEIGGARDIGRNHAIIHTEAPHAIHLNRKENRDAVFVKFTRQLDHRRTAQLWP